jgi:RNA polymerase sigma factor (sigma-70 family)
MLLFVALLNGASGSNLLRKFEVIFMGFSELFRKIEHKLRFLARKYKTMCSYFDEEDLYQEMCSYLWRTFKDGVPSHLNDTYIIRGCEFHILNYLRKEKEKIIKMSLEQELNEEGGTLKDILASREEAMDNYLDKKLTIDYIMNNGFSRREKEVFSLLIKGYTVREAGRVLGISHVMVVKLKASLVKKYQRDIKKGVTKNRANLLN